MLGAVAGVAIEAGLPFVSVPFGTRNHFARDAGFDLEDPLGALAAFGDGRELEVDAARVEERVFLNNVSLGVYAQLVHDPQHETKNRIVALGRLFTAAFGRSRRRLDVLFEADGTRERHDAVVMLVSNNAYGLEPGEELGCRRAPRRGPALRLRGRGRDALGARQAALPRRARTGRDRRWLGRVLGAVVSGLVEPVAPARSRGRRGGRARLEPRPRDPAAGAARSRSDRIEGSLTKPPAADHEDVKRQ